jgi:hypothetical protein
MIEALLEWLEPQEAGVTVHLGSGQRIRGMVLKLGDAWQGQRMLLLQHAEARGDVLYVPLGSIEALTLHEASRFVPKSGLPTRLDLKRSVAAIAQQLGAVAVDVGWPSDDDAEALASIASVVAALERVVPAIMADDLGRKAVATKLRRIQISVANTRELAWSQGEWRVALVPGESVTPEELQGALESVL